jgi:transposase
MSTKRKPSPDSIVREIKRKTRRKYSAEEKIRIVLEGLRGEQSITDLCRREGIHPGIYYKWSKTFLEAGKMIYNLSYFGLCKDNRKSSWPLGANQAV